MKTLNVLCTPISLVLVVAVITAGGCVDNDEQTVCLVREGTAQAVIVLPKEADDLENLAAREIARYVAKISGAELAIIGTGEEISPEISTRILLGSAAEKAIPNLNVQRALSERGNKLREPEGFVLRVQEGVVALAGLNSQGTLYAAYDLLERLGCRWFFPGELGEVVPKVDTLELKPFESVQTPSLEFRFILKSGEGSVGYQEPTLYDENINTDEIFVAWSRRNRLSADRSWWNFGHNIAGNERVTDPALVDKLAGRALRYFKENPQAQMFSLGWADSQVPLEADKAMGVPHLWDKEYQAIDPMIHFNNQVAERVLADYPDKLFGFLVYQNYLGTPIKYRPNPSLQPVIATIEQCPRHVPGTGQCWQRDAVNQIIKDWCGLSDKVIVYEYMPGFLVDGGLPMPDITRIRVEIPKWVEWGLRGMFTQSQLSVMNTGPNSYVRAKLFWNSQADVDALLDEYYALLFGPAAKSVRKYWDTLENMMHHGTGHQHEDEIAKVIYPIDDIRELEKHIIKAENAANTDLIRRRVQMVRFSYDNLMLYLQMRRAEDQGDFTEARQLAEQMLELHHEIEAVNPVFYKIGDLDRGNEDHSHMAGGWISQNRARLERIDGTSGNLVAMLPDKWRFTTDPHDNGIIFRWFEPSYSTRHWQAICTSSVWEVQGYEDQAGHGYDGVGWYRTTINVPDEFVDRQIKLNFGGVFGKLIIWVNGEFVAYRPFKTPWWYNPYNTTFDIDISSAIRAGHDNTIVIRVDNEFEWGGIYRRLFLWTP